MAIEVFNPLSDRRWDDLVNRHPSSSVFHRTGWLEALRSTYGYEPLVITAGPQGAPLSGGVVFCRVSSWITGTRLVSLPFSDHCDPLLNDSQDLSAILNSLRAESSRQGWKYVELRPLSQIQDGGHVSESARFCLHELDLGPSLGRLFEGLHRDCMQRKIRKAEREALSYEVGTSKDLVDDFYQLQLITRRRHRLIPQPRFWFQNLMEWMGDDAQIRLVRKGGTLIAALLTLRHRSSVVYKYGCSDDKFHHLGGIPFLFWRLVEESKLAGVTHIDLGRSDLDQAGLLAFKDRLGATRRSLTYYRYPAAQKTESATNRATPIRRLFGVLPDILSSTAGRILYKHVG